MKIKNKLEELKTAFIDGVVDVDGIVAAAAADITADFTAAINDIDAAYDAIDTAYDAIDACYADGADGALADGALADLASLDALAAALGAALDAARAARADYDAAD